MWLHGPRTDSHKFRGNFFPVRVMALHQTTQARMKFSRGCSESRKVNKSVLCKNGEIKHRAASRTDRVLCISKLATSIRQSSAVQQIQPLVNRYVRKSHEARWPLRTATNNGDAKSRETHTKFRMWKVRMWRFPPFSWRQHTCQGTVSYFHFSKRHSPWSARIISSVLCVFIIKCTRYSHGANYVWILLAVSSTSWRVRRRRCRFPRSDARREESISRSPSRSACCPWTSSSTTWRDRCSTRCDSGRFSVCENWTLWCWGTRSVYLKRENTFAFRAFFPPDCHTESFVVRNFSDAILAQRLNFTKGQTEAQQSESFSTRSKHIQC